MGKGRKKIPTALNILNGNPGKRPINGDEPQPDRTPPAMPAWLTAEAKREWKRVAPELERLGLLTCVDGTALASYCQSYARYIKADKEGRVNEACKHLAFVKAFCVEFGLTPSSRGRMTIPGKAPILDPLESMLNESMKN